MPDFLLHWLNASGTYSNGQILLIVLEALAVFYLIVAVFLPNSASSWLFIRGNLPTVFQVVIGLGIAIFILANIAGGLSPFWELVRANFAQNGVEWLLSIGGLILLVIVQIGRRLYRQWRKTHRRTVRPISTDTNS